MSAAACCTSRAVKVGFVIPEGTIGSHTKCPARRLPVSFFWNENPTLTE